MSGLFSAVSGAVSGILTTMAHTLKRAEVATLLGKSTRTIRRWEGDKLSIVVGPDGEALFDEKEVTRLLAEQSGDIAPLETKELKQRVEALEKKNRLLETKVRGLDTDLQLAKQSLSNRIDLIKRTLQ